MIARAVAAIIPPMTPVPMECRLAEPAPVDIASGSTPRMNASEVMTMGRKRRPDLLSGIRWHTLSHPLTFLDVARNKSARASVSFNVIRFTHIVRNLVAKLHKILRGGSLA
jgi:hypothetical protein